MKKLLTALLSLLLCASLTACGMGKKGSDEFAQYMDEIPPIILDHFGFNINFLFDHPENYGIDKELYSLDFLSLEDYKNANDSILEKLDELDDYDYDELNQDQKIVYDLLKKEAEDNGFDDEDYYYLTTNYFDTNSGVQSQLPMSLWCYEFKNQKSLDSFLAILNDAPDIFKKYTDLEQTRQDKGYGMSQTYMDEVLEALHTINTTDQSFIIEAANEKIDALDFLNAEEKQVYKEKIKTAFNNSLLPAFQQAESDLSAINVVKEGDGELSSYKNGKEYYEDMVTSAAGVETMEEYEQYLEKENEKVQGRLMELLMNTPELKDSLLDADKLMEKMQNIHYTDLTTSQEVIQFLEKQIQERKDFPKIQLLDYEMKQFPEAMKETTLAAAAYFLSAYDDPSGKDEQMILNGTFKQSNFTTIAHESFPGHMYQHNYFKTVDHHILRDILSSSTYAEGWATYIEDVACEYSQEPGMCHLNNINNQFVYLMVLDLDEQIHYDGISRSEAYAYLEQTFGITDEEDKKAQYEQLLENPAIFANYYVGYYKLLDLKEKAEETWKEDYSDYRFHEEILDLGPLPMDLLEKYIEL